MCRPKLHPRRTCSSKPYGHPGHERATRRSRPIRNESRRAGSRHLEAAAKGDPAILPDNRRSPLDRIPARHPRRPSCICSMTWPADVRPTSSHPKITPELNESRRADIRHPRSCQQTWPGHPNSTEMPVMRALRHPFDDSIPSPEERGKS